MNEELEGVPLAAEPDTYRATLVRATELVGGAVPLSHRLQLPIADLTRWLAGDGKPSIGTFLRVIDLVLEESRRGRVVQSSDDPPQP